MFYVIFNNIINLTEVLIMYAMELPKDFLPIAKRVMRGERVLLSCTENEKIVVISEQEFNKLESTRKKALERFRENNRRMQEQSVINGTDKMTMDEINEIIKEVRQERKGENR